MISAALLGLATLSGACQDPQPSPDQGSETSSAGDQGPKDDPNQEDKEDKAFDCDKLVATGNDPGEIPVDLTRIASDGQEISLRSYCNDPLLVLSGTAFCTN